MNPSTSSPNHWPNGVTYEIFVQSFADSNGDGIGDINGLAQKLDYLVELGIDAIWLMPIHPSPSYHKYDVTDYYGIHPDYGTMDDFKRFLKEAHQKNLKVVIDLVINHTSHKHPWFVESKKGSDNPYREFYIWRDYEEVKDEIAKKTITLDSDNITQWHENPDDTERYYGFFWWEMPDLNYDSPKVREEIYKVGRYWLEEIGVDGFRLDAAGHIYPDDRKEDAYAFWEEFRGEMQKVKPDVYLVGEIWGKPEKLAPYLNGLPSLFNFSLSEAITQTLQGKKEKPILQSLINTLEAYEAVNPEFIDATILSNHDQNRIMSELDGDIAKAKMAASLLFTLPGSPYLYYGEEIGMMGKKPDEQIREPFIWDEPGKDPLQTNWEELVYNGPDSIQSLAQQKEDSQSLFNHYKNLIQLRKAFPALREGNFQVLGQNAFVRSLSDSLTIVHNVTPTGEGFTLYPPVTKFPMALSLPSYHSIIIFQKEKEYYLKLLPEWVDIQPEKDTALVKKYLIPGSQD